MILGIVMLMFIGVTWTAGGINQAHSLLRIMSRLRQQAWNRCGIKYKRIAINIDTTVETIYGKQQ
ncbi:MAG: hypothetical protein OS130_12355 [Thermodesulfobacteriota bacterium]|jgi:hypothetical protein|nr:MAG: hypothetical protein OS130_12355 [Thermodesulfobacteriota bacterium]